MNTITIVATRPDGVPLIKASGDVGAFLEIWPTPTKDEDFFVATSDGTLLRGSVIEGFRIEMAGTSPVTIERCTDLPSNISMATFADAIEWVSVGRTWENHPERYTAEQTARDKAEDFEGAEDLEGPEDLEGGATEDGADFMLKGEIEDLTHLSPEELSAEMVRRYGPAAG